MHAGPDVESVRILRRTELLRRTAHPIDNATGDAGEIRVNTDRPKSGFEVPVGEWIKVPFRDWAEELLNPRTLRTRGWFDADLVSERWRDHLSGRRDSTAALWAVMMFQAWLTQHGSPSTAAA